MTFALDKNVDWTDHYIEYGFAVLKGLVDRTYCAEALAEIRRLLNSEQPLAEWTTSTPGQKYRLFAPQENEVLEKLYKQRPLRETLGRLFGGGADGHTIGNLCLWLNPFNPSAKATFNPLGHIDSGCPYRGLSFQVALVETEPFSGNTTVFPGTHKLLQKALLDNPQLDGKGGGSFLEVRRPLEPYEFIAEPGDVLFLHHLAFHSGNPSHSANRKPRIALRAEVFPAVAVAAIDPGKGGLSPWERSLALNGYVKINEESTALA